MPSTNSLITEMTAIFISLAFCFVLIGAVCGNFKCHDPLEDEEFDVPGNNVLMTLYKNSNELSNGNGNIELKQFVCDLSERYIVIGKAFDYLAQQKCGFFRRLSNNSAGLRRGACMIDEFELLKTVDELDRPMAQLMYKLYKSISVLKHPIIAENRSPMATECRHRPARMDSALISASDSISSSTAFARSVSAAIGVHQQQRFILILHHENVKNRDLKKFHRLLIKNLEIYAKEEGIKVVDVDQCICDQDLLGSVSRHFDRADQVVMELSPNYADLISATEGASSLADQLAVNDQQQIDQRVRMKLYLRQMTFNEVLLNGNQNRRFRVVLMQGCRPEHIPRGWPGNTLHNRFPQDFEALCQRLFEQQKQRSIDDPS
uniref:Uncharacterized protein n=1 Tax=Globodera rostochiensis TaxID=31243 RepID=A0A914HS79_GLORO